MSWERKLPLPSCYRHLSTLLYFHSFVLLVQKKRTKENDTSPQEFLLYKTHFETRPSSCDLVKVRRRFPRNNDCQAEVRPPKAERAWSARRECFIRRIKFPWNLLDFVGHRFNWHHISNANLCIFGTVLYQDKMNEYQKGLKDLAKTKKRLVWRSYWSFWS